MDQLNAEQAQALWEAGGFLIITDLPEGSEFGIDGTFHTVRKFSGIKFLPPGLHFIAWSPPSSTAGPSVIQIRQAFVRNFSTKERYAVHYNKDTENTRNLLLIRSKDLKRGNPSHHTLPLLYLRLSLVLMVKQMA